MLDHLIKIHIITVLYMLIKYLLSIVGSNSIHFKWLIAIHTHIDMVCMYVFLSCHRNTENALKCIQRCTMNCIYSVDIRILFMFQPRFYGNWRLCFFFSHFSSFRKFHVNPSNGKLVGSWREAVWQWNTPLYHIILE